MRLALVASLLLAGCPRGKTVDVSPLAAEDESLKKNESDLLGQRGSLQRERKTLDDKRAELVDRRKQLGHDSAGQAALDEEEKKLVDQESALANREDDLNKKLDQLLAQREGLVQKATQTVAGAAGADPLERAARREQGVASREKELAEREKTLAAREKDLAEREAREAKREKETCGAQPAQIEIPKGLKYSAKDVEPIYKKALKLMHERGVLPADLPAGQERLVEETREAMKKADYVRAKYDADALLSSVEAIKIDRAFISAKMARLASAMRGRKLEGDQRKKVESLFQEATANYGDGKFPQANGRINTLFAMLK
jgi:hypothetical protein